MKPAKVPADLRPFVPIAEKWGAVNGNSEVYALADRAKANPKEMAELRSFASQFSRGPQAAFRQWRTTTSITESHEYAKFYFLFMLLDDLDIKLAEGPMSEPP